MKKVVSTTTDNFTFEISHEHRFEIGEGYTGIKLTRVEYYEPTIESYFIAVYKSTQKLNSSSESFYCISPTNESKRDISYQYIADTLLTEKLKRKLNIQPVYQWETKHLQIKAPESLFSVLSFQEKSGIVSYLTEMKGSKINLLFKQTDEYSFWDILPIPIYQNDKPILLITMAVPETDRNLEYTPFIFNGTKYIPFYNNRINLVK